MSDQEIPFFTQAAILDTFIQSPNPHSDPEIMGVVIEALKSKPDLRKYFFRRSPHPVWALILWHSGFLITPPEPERTSQGYVLSPWDAQDYMVSVAKYVPDIVVEHVKTLEGHGFYKQKAVRALRELPPDKVEQVLPVILNWLGDLPTARFIAEETLGLMTSLAKRDGIGSAFTLFITLTAPRPPQNIKKYGEMIFNDEATSILSTDNFHRKAIRDGINILMNLDLPRTVSILEEHLCSSLQIESEAGERPNYKDSSFWRTAVEDTGQDRYGEYKDFLLESLRDALEKWAQQDSSTLTPLTDKYLNDLFEILRRLGLHILQRFPDSFKDLVIRELTKTENFEDVGIHHEFFMLLQQGYPHLPPTEQEIILNRILNGPSAELLQRIAEGESEEERAEDMKRYSRLWMLKRLWMIKEYLIGANREMLDTLVGEFGEPDHPAYTHWLSQPFSVTEVSPISKEDLNLKSPDELISYLKEWCPNRNGIGPRRESHGPLAGEVADLVWSDLPKFRDRIIEIAFIRPEYASGLLYRSPKPENDIKEVWDVRLTICERLLADEHIRTDMTQSVEGAWLHFRHSAVHLLENALTGDSVNVPAEFLHRIRDILIILVEDPDPDFESDRPREDMIGHEDPITVAINHVRSQALIGLVNYAYYIARRMEEGNPRPAGTNRLEPEVEAALTRKVNFRNDPSLSLHSVYGRELVKLYKLHQQWVRDHVDEIFPLGDDLESISFYVAAWDAYVISSDTYSDILDFLRSRYERAIENLSKGYVTKTHLRPTERLANHLLAEYLNSEYDIRAPEGQQSLIARFFQRTLSEDRAQAAWTLAEMCDNEKDLPGKFWVRARALWQWRADEAAAANHPADFHGEMEEFSRLLSVVPSSENIVTLWPLLEGLLQYAARGEYFDTIWDALETYLTKEVEHDPVRVIRIYRLMHDQLKDYNQYHSGDPQKIIEAGVTNEASRNETLQIIDRIKRLGGHQFDDIYKRFVK